MNISVLKQVKKIDFISWCISFLIWTSEVNTPVIEFPRGEF